MKIDNIGAVGSGKTTLANRETGIPVVFVRKKPKEYGTCKLAEGTEFRNKRVCIIERNPEGRKKLKESGLELKSLFTMIELKRYE